MVVVVVEGVGVGTKGMLGLREVYVGASET